jgi:hypothetical protein
MQVAMIMKEVNEQFFNLNTYHNDITSIAGLFHATSIYCNDLLADTEFLDFLRSRNYSVGMAQFFEGCAFGLFELLGIKSTHQLMAIPVEEQSAYLHGLPQMPSYVRGKPLVLIIESRKE